MDYQTLIYTVEGGVATITLNRPDKLNSFNGTLHKEFLAALRQVERDQSVRVVVITGVGRAFSAGQDLQDLPRTPLGDFLRRTFNASIFKLRTLEKPVIAAVNGVAAGAGCSLALACDLVVLSEKAVLMQAFVKVGLVPDSGASYFLPRLIGYHKAMELALFGDKVTADQALAMGLCNRVVPEAELSTVVSAWAERLAKGPRSMGWVKRQFSRGLDQSLEEILELEAFGQDAASATADAAEAVAAFLEKREPVFTGR